MERQAYTDATARQAPVSPGSRPAHFLSSLEAEGACDRGGDGRLTAGGDRDHPGKQPDEIVPNTPDTDRPDRTPDEVQPGQGDFDQPGSVPAESPPEPDTVPTETPPPD